MLIATKRGRYLRFCINKISSGPVTVYLNSASARHRPDHMGFSRSKQHKANTKKLRLNKACCPLPIKLRSGVPTTKMQPASHHFHFGSVRRKSHSDANTRMTMKPTFDNAHNSLAVRQGSAAY